MKTAETKHLRVKEGMTIYHAPKQIEQFLTALAQTEDLELDLKEVAEIDTAGLQLLLLLKREATRQKKNFSLINHGPQVLHAIDLCHLAGAFGDPMVITSQSPPEPADAASTQPGDPWYISIRFGADMLRHGNDPLTVLNGLAALGDVVMMETISESLPPAAEMDPESCYLGFEIRLRTEATKAQIEEIFKFVQHECTLHILPPDSKVADFLALIASLPAETMRLGDILVRSGALTKAELDAGLVRQRDAGAAVDEAGEAQPDAAPIGEILVDQKNVPREVVEAAADKQKAISEKQAADASLIRVHAEKLDQLIDLVGELVIAGASSNLQARRNGDVSLIESTSVLTRLVENIRDSALQLRMVQIGETFNRFRNVTRDLAQELGKDIDLVISGAETEVDKSVVEKIGDPLMHLVRNALNHGIEAAEVRAAAGKPAQGRVELNAFHDSGSIVIEIADDGRGLDLDALQATAIEKGHIQPGQTLSDQEISNLIFKADESAGVSGMNVVSKNIAALRGTVVVKTEPGLGSRFTIRLPLTLAIIDGFLTGVAKSSYVIPLDMVVECIELANTSADRDYINLRGEVLPYVRLREMFEVPGDNPPRENVVVVQYAGQKAGIVVDQLLGEFQTVIKPLGTLFKNMRGIGGSTILGSGEVALILDVQALVSRSAKSEEHATHGATGMRRLVEMH